MQILLNNISWMGFNAFLALIPPIFGWLLLKTRQLALKIAFALIWFIFLPNTLYLITDLPHMTWQWHRMHHAGQIALALQYLTLVLIGLITFILALYPVEKALLQSSWPKKKALVPVLIIVTNCFIGLGIVLGRVQRINSWDMIVDIPKVIDASKNIFTSLDLILLVLLFGLFANVYYFLCRKSFQPS
jgi:uncharacterized membrane protein